MANWIYRGLAYGFEGAVDLDQVHHISWDDESLEIEFVKQSEQVQEPGGEELLGPHRGVKYRHRDTVVWSCEDEVELKGIVEAVLKHLGAVQVLANPRQVARHKPRRRGG